MKIAQAQVQLTGQRESARAQSREVTRFPASPPATLPGGPASTSVSLSTEAMAAGQLEQSSDPYRQSLESNPLWHLVRQLVRHITGQAIDVEDVVPAGASDANRQSNQAGANNAGRASTGTPLTAPDTTSGIATESTYEVEQTTVTASGIILTSDGREIAISTSLSMERLYIEQRTSVVPPAPRKTQDPLVLNYAAPAASLLEQTIDFDLLGNGDSRQIAMLGSGSGYLALDRNGNGQVDDGRELFGTHSGDGFADLAAYDDDGNGWMDENDRTWAELKVWIQVGGGQNKLIDLQKLGIGAIHLSRASSEFDLKDRQNQLLGRVRSTGIFLREDGSAGTVQQVDLSV